MRLYRFARVSKWTFMSMRNEMKGVFMRRVVLAAVLFSLSALAKDPQYRADTSEPPAFDAQPRTPGTSTNTVLEKWWASLSDPQLETLAERAIRNNLDLRLATQRLLEARAARRISKSDLLPSVEANTSFQPLRGGFENGNIHVGDGPGASSLISPFETNVFRGGFNASWELDLFGGKRQALQAATAEVKVSEESRRDVLVSMLGEVVANYAELRGAQQRLAITLRNGNLQKDSLGLTEVRAKAGLGNTSSMWNGSRLSWNPANHWCRRLNLRSSKP